MKLLMNLALLCTLPIAAGAYSDNAVSRQLRRSPHVEYPELHTSAVIPLPIEPKKEGGQEVMNDIHKFRAEICAKMKDEHGKKFGSYEACEKFMKEACNPGKDKAMDGGKGEITSQQGFCKEYFPKPKKKAEVKKEETKKEKEKDFVVVNSTAPAPAPSPGPRTETVPMPAPAAVAGKAPASALAPAPSPGPLGSPIPGPAPAPFIPGVSAGKPWGPIKDDEKWYYKKGGKDPMRLHMNGDLKLPGQGYWGKLVAHEDQKTATEDWGREFGPLSGHESLKAVCKEYPDNPWCSDYFPHHKSSCPTVPNQLVQLVVACVAFLAF